MSMPWTCDALLPQAERYASLKFRRVAQRFDITRIDYADGCELAAFLRVVPVEFARHIFHWKGAGVRDAERVLKHLSDSSDVDRMVEDNLAGKDEADGLAVLQAMRDGGWTKGAVPGVVREALLEMRNRGISQPAIGRELGLSIDQVRVMANGRRLGRAGRGPRLSGGGFFAV